MLLDLHDRAKLTELGYCPMTKSIHIARAEVHEMAKELARLKGTTIVAAVTEALRERLIEVEAQKKAGTFKARPARP